MTPRTWFAFGVVALLLSGCGERLDDPGPGPAGAPDPIAGDYVSDAVPGPHFRGDDAPRLRMTLRDGGVDEVGEGAAPTVPLEGTSWTLTGIAEYDGDTGSVSSTPAGVTASLRIQDGRVELDTGCNSGSGPVVVGNETLAFGDLAVTLRGCLDARADVERSVLRVLRGEEVGWSIAGRELRLRKGGHELIYRAAGG